MKEKFIAFFKKPINIIAVALAFLGVIGVILTCVIPTGTYSGTYYFDDEQIEYKYVIKKDKISAYGKLENEWEADFEDDAIEIRGGKIYEAGVGGEEYGKINGIHLEMTFDGETMRYTNKLALAFLIVSCVFVAAGAAGIVYTTFIDKKKKTVAA